MSDSPLWFQIVVFESLLFAAVAVAVVAFGLTPLAFGGWAVGVAAGCLPLVLR